MRRNVLLVLALLFCLAVSAWAVESSADIDARTRLDARMRISNRIQVINQERVDALKDALQARQTAVVDARDAFREKALAVRTATQERLEALRREAIRPYLQYSKSKLAVLRQRIAEMKEKGIPIPPGLEDRLDVLESDAPSDASTDATVVAEYAARFRAAWSEEWWALKVKWSEDALVKLETLVDRAEEFFLKIKDSEAYAKPNIQERVDHALERIDKYQSVIARLKESTPDRTFPNKVARIARSIHQDLRVLHRWLIAFRAAQSDSDDAVSALDVQLSLSTDVQLTTSATTEDRLSSSEEGFDELDDSDLESDDSGMDSDSDNMEDDSGEGEAS